MIHRIDPPDGPRSESSVPPLGSVGLTRRAVLVGGAAAFVLAACSSDSSSGDSSATTAPPQRASLMALFPLNDHITAGVPQRIAFGLADPRGGGLSAEGPDQVDFTIVAPDGSTTTQTAAAHHQDLPFVYYPIRFTPDAAGNFTVEAVVEGDEVNAVFTIAEEGASPVPGPGDPLPSMASPTLEAHLGVDPICTRDPHCEMHQVSLDTALGESRPVVYLVATPKFCQMGVCGPVLDVLESVVGEYADRVTFIHQEVYRSATEAAEKGAAATLTEQVEQLELLSEPVLFITDRDGVIRHRLDTAYDRVELTESLEDVLS